MSIFSGSWKTTASGIVMILGAVIHIIFTIKSGMLTESELIAGLTAIVGGVGLMQARDNDKSSEQVGAGNTGAIEKKGV